MITKDGDTIHPGVGTVSVRSVVHPLSDVKVVFRVSFPEALALPHPVFPLSLVFFPVVPAILAEARCFALLKLTLVEVAIGMLFEAAAMSQVVFPEPFVPPADIVNHESPSVSLSFCAQLSNVNGVFIPLDRENVADLLRFVQLI